MACVQLIYDTTCCSMVGVCCLWTVPNGVTQINIEIWGGGGGGSVASNCSMCDCCARGAPGAGGGYSKKLLGVTAGSQYTVCAGPGGLSNTASCGYAYGGAVGACCCNGVNGGTSYVTGTGLTTFCATGGQGGPTNITQMCYSHCGCTFFSSMTPGMGYGGDITICGHLPYIGHFINFNASTIASIGGSAAGPGGGAGGFNVPANCMGQTWSTDTSTNGDCTLMHGSVPGGGGAGAGWMTCDCVTMFRSGRGAPGAVKITY
jgi:hypothetical protein